MLKAGVFYDKEAIETAIKRVEESFPGRIAHIRYTVGNDWSDEPAIFLRVLLTDAFFGADVMSLRDPFHRPTVFQLARDITTGLQAQFEDGAIQPYYAFRTVSEQEELRNSEWD